MDLSGLIFVALAVVWAVVLIPMALRHHDEAAKTRAVDHFSDDLRVVARREAVTTRQSRLVVPPRATGPRDMRPGVPAAPAAPAAGPVTEQRPLADRVADAAVRRAADRATARAAAKRRRIVLGLLLLATAGVGIASSLGTLQPWAPAIPGGLVLGFLLLARVLVKREHRAWAAQRRREALWSEVTQGVDRTPVPAATGPARATTDEIGDGVDEAVPAAPSPVSAPFLSGLDDTCAVPVGLTPRGTPVEGLWDPLPVTLPTYVTKPRAQRSVRTIDMLAPGVQSSGRNAADSALVAETATASTAPPEEQGRRAVGH